VIIGTFLYRTSAKKNSDESSSLSSASITDPFLAANLKRGKKPNRFIIEKSPYLLQHAFDPVDWNPWGDAAFEKARKEHKPIFLSIGYASCFACYTMQRDVFENPKIAHRMNQYSVNVMVDREERPDIDRIYMSVLQTTSGSGGWPMSFFLTDDRKPFFGSASISATVFSEVLDRVHELWLQQPATLSDFSNSFASYMKQTAGNGGRTAATSEGILRKGFNSFRQLYDPQFGGFGSAPKFPHPMILNFLLRYYSRTGEKTAQDMALVTLRKMEAGAVFDHIGYGFHRYSADDEWRTPHFEKMLYDQALLTIAYLEAFQSTHDPAYSTTVRNILSFVQREMVSQEGGFYGAQDAASSVESSNGDHKMLGIFYTWTSAEVTDILGASDAPVFEFLWGIRPEGNSLRDPMNLLANRNVIFRAHTIQEAANTYHKKTSEIESILGRDLQKLFEARERRPKPQIDDKIILSWNALMISAFARAFEVLGDQTYLRSAERCSAFLEDKLISPKTGELLRRYRNGEARYEANLQDYSFYIQALLDLYEASFDIRYLKSAITLEEKMEVLFADNEKGGFFDTDADDHSLPVRTRDLYDDSEPSGNSIAILDLLRLSQITGNNQYQATAERALQFLSSSLSDHPETMPQLLIALQFSLQKPKEIVIAGSANDPLTKALLHEIHSRFLPDKIILLADGGEGQKTLSSFLPFLSAVKMIHGRPTAYLCENSMCKLPTSDPVSFAAILQEQAKR
jgi:uncharacterized protein YyaL (SSP411 family)